MQSRRWHDFNFILLGGVLVLLCFGVAMVYSTTIGQSGLPAFDASSPFTRHLLWIGVGLAVMTIATLTDYHLLAAFAAPLYLVMVLMLVAVLAVGEEKNGCKCWLGGGSLQPSEVSKLLLIIALAAYWAGNEERQGSWRGLIGSLFLLAPPLVMVLRQPDLGTVMVIVSTWLVMAWTAKLRWTQIALMIALAIPAAIFAWDHLEHYQKLRLLTFLDAEKYADGPGWQVIQSKYAIGSGGLWGQGLNHGIQSQRNFLPVQSSDFIFAVVGEELGFIGSTALLCFLTLVIWQAWKIAEQARDSFGRLLAAGIAGMLLFHVFENVGMTMSLTPMTGIPLPFISLGGSFMITTLAAIGVLQSIALRRRPLVF